MKKYLPFISLLLFFFIFPSCVWAKDYTSSYDVTYNVLENGATHVEYVVDLTNTASKVYNTSYKLSLGLDNIQNVQASDKLGSINPIVVKKDDGYTISLRFNDKVVGIGKTLRFKVSFNTKDIIQNNGNILEINIPGIAKENNYSKFDVHVNVPLFLGSPTYVKPKSISQKLDFNKEQLEKSGISIAFGDYQIYTFNLKYHLKNPNLFPVKTQVALPPSTNYQEVFIEKIGPKPLSVIRDADGNWLAQYSLKSSEKIDVSVKGKAKVFLNPKKEELNQRQREEYLKETAYWQVSNNKIRELAEKLKTPSRIYQYVTEYLSYDFSRVTENKPRLGAASLLDNPKSAVCLEFTDFFITLSRAAGIPAREVDGFAYAKNSKQRPISLVKDVLHAWPEYYDKTKKAWIMVDPTWGNTTKGVDYFNTLDFDHFAFVIRGKSSDFPIPPGSYKQRENLGTKDVEVGFAKDLEEPTSILEVTSSIPEVVISGFSPRGIVTIKNAAGSFLPSEDIFISSNDLLPQTIKKTAENLPPFGEISIPFSFNPTHFDYQKQTSIIVNVRNKVIEKKIEIRPFYQTTIGLGGSILVGIFTIIIFITATRTWRIFIP